ncbi:MAG: hypothetical protein GOVbin2669_46 [Prokaryotic dsDNA virus sp.]|nr:MAG: hypothetical protein GOVbin2669_46 [Prokaryotic dsDNA virus sp.]|tara:strand:+ start:7644 stop:8348 length:705 start_codon:yes stop_codon:yes gene_type:complete
MELKDKILKALGLSEEVKLEFQTRLEDGTIIVSTANALEASVDVSVLTEDGTTIPLPVGTYKTEDGVGFTVEEEGVISEILDEEVEEEEAEEEEKYEDEEEEEVEMEEEIIEEVKEPTEIIERLPKKIKTTEELEFSKEELINAVTEVVTEMLGNMKTEVTELSSVVDEMRGYKETLEEETIELQKEVEKLSKEPAAVELNTNKFSTNNKTELSKAQYNNLSAKERFLYNLNNN